MKISTWKSLRGALAVAFPALAALSSSVPALVYAEDDVQEGRIVNLSPDRGEQDGAAEEEVIEEAKAAAPKYWVGLQGRPIDSRVLRTQLQLAGDVGVAIEEVISDSPAAKAGLRQDDILIAVNGEPLADLGYLQSVVAEQPGKPIALKILRLAKEETIEVVPEEIPAEMLQRLAAAQQRSNPFGMMQGNFDPQSLMEQLRQGRGQGGMRVIGPGMIFEQQSAGDAQIPNGVSVSVARNGDQTQITVKKGDQTWTVDGDDAESLAELPDDVRPMVEQMLHGRQFGFGGLPNFDFGDRQQWPLGELRQFDAGGAGDGFDLHQKRMLERLEQMEQRMRELQEQLRSRQPADDSRDELDRRT